jgi:membrane protease YdiL (CAAX protease family)
MLRVTWWLVLGWAAGAGFEELCAHLRLPASAVLFWECGWYLAILAFVAYLVHRDFGTPWVELVPIRRVSARLIAPVLAMTIGGFVLTVQVVGICRAILPDLSAGGPDGLLDHSLPTQYVGMSLIPAVLEEVLFRGIVLQVLLALDMSERRAIAFSAFLFAVVHFNLVGFPGHFLWGVLVGWMFVRTRSLIPGMLMHAGHNAICVATVHYSSSSLPPGAGGWLGFDRSAMLPALTGWAGLALTVIGVVAFRRALARQARTPRACDWTNDALQRAA